MAEHPSPATIPTGAEPGPWGPQRHGGRRLRWLRRLGLTVVIGTLVLLVAVGTTAALLVQQAETNLTRIAVPELTEEVDEGEPLPRATARHFLVVGSDGRDELDAAARRELTLGSFDGQRADTVLYVAITEDRGQVALVSLPRDLLVLHQGRESKLTDTFAGGPDDLVRAVRGMGLPVSHYGEVSIAGFIEVVRTLGTVEICLDTALVDRRSGADFTAGCHDMDAVDALAFVRSRRGDRADYERIDRQQQFLRAVLTELTSARVLADPRRLFRLVEDVASNVTTDDALEVTTMLSLADELRLVVQGGIPMTTVPAYPRTIDGGAYMVAYRPGTDALLRDLRAGRPLADRGTRDQRAATQVAILSGGRAGNTEVLRGTLMFAGFVPAPVGTGPAELDAGPRTTVYALPGEDEAAGWVAATLGAPIRPLPAGIDPPAGARVVVAAGDDAVADGPAGG